MKIKRALLSVSDKTGIVELGKFLSNNGVEIISTGGTMKALREAGVPVTYVSDVTGFPEIMASHEDLLASALNLDRGRISRYCRTVDPRFLERLNNRKPTTMAALADIWYGSQNADYRQRRALQRTTPL